MKKMKTKKKQNKKMNKGKFDWILYFAIIGWTGIVALWVWQAIKLFMVEDSSKGILYLVIAGVFLFIGIKSTISHVNKKKIKPKKK